MRKMFIRAKDFDCGYMVTGHQAISFRTNETGFVVLDLSRCFSERRKSICIKEQAHKAYEHPTASP